MNISQVPSRVYNYVKDLPKPRPETTADTAGSSPETAAISGGISGYFSGDSPLTAVGGAVGGYVGIKVGQKTESLSKAVGASFLAGAGATAAVTTGYVLAKAAICNLPAGINPIGLALFSTVGGLTGVSGLMQGGCMGDVKDSGTAGMILGTTMSAMGGSPLLNVAGSLAGAAGGMVENKGMKALVSAGTGAALGALAGAFGGPIGMAINAVMGAVAGVGASLGGPAFGQIQRNLMHDLQSGIFGKIKNFVGKLGKTGRTLVGALGGAISGIPMALLGAAVLGPLGAAVPILIMGGITGYKVHNVLKEKEHASQYTDSFKQFLKNDIPQEVIDQQPPELIEGYCMLFAKKYKTPEEFSKISIQDFRKDMAEFNNASQQAAQQAAQQVQQAQQAQQETPGKQIGEEKAPPAATEAQPPADMDYQIAP